MPRFMCRTAAGSKTAFHHAPLHVPHGRRTPFYPSTLLPFSPTTLLPRDSLVVLCFGAALSGAIARMTVTFAVPRDTLVVLCFGAALSGTIARMTFSITTISRAFGCSGGLVGSCVFSYTHLLASARGNNLR